MDIILQEFIRLTVEGREVKAEVGIRDAFPVFDLIGKALKESGLSNQKVIRMRRDCFSIACPQCGAVISGDKFVTAFLIWVDHPDSGIAAIEEERHPDGQIFTTARFNDGGAVTARGPGRVFRLINGQCVNDACKSLHVVMRWTPSQKIP
jgi:hypothetical protein